MTSSLPQPHHAFVETIRAEAARDPRVTALLAGGSYIHGGFDRHSDLDFVVVVEDDAYQAAMADRERFAERLGELLSAFTGEHVGEPRLLICLYGPPLLHVDLKFVTAHDLDRRIERPAVLYARDRDAIEARLDAATIAWPNASADWFERRAWIWLHYAATKWARGELFEAIGMLAFFRDQVLGPMLHRRAGRPQRGVRRLEMSAEGAHRRLLATMPAHDADSVRGALNAAIDLYLELRDDEPPQRPVSRMPQALRDYLGQASQAPA